MTLKVIFWPAHVCGHMCMHTHIHILRNMYTHDIDMYAKKKGEFFIGTNWL